MPAIDEEMLDALDDNGYTIGKKPRKEVHRDGDWHRLVFVWASHIDATGASLVTMQVRGRPGDPYLGHLDAVAGGHAVAGESPEGSAVRELAEEVGSVLDEPELVLLGTCRLENPTGICRRVFQHHYLFFGELSGIVPSEEVLGLIEVEVGELVDMIEGTRDRARVSSVKGGVAGRLRGFGTYITSDRLMKYSSETMTIFRKALGAFLDFHKSGRIGDRNWC